MNTRRNLKYIPTKTIRAILDEPYCRGVDGFDYGPVKHELEEILWKRETQKGEEEYERLIKERGDYETE